MSKICSLRGILAGCFLAALNLLVIQATHAATACVWRVTNTPAPCYLVGTLHALSGKDYPLPGPYYQAMKECQQFYFEVSPYMQDEQEFGKLWEEATTYPKGDEIRHHIHPKTWSFLEKKFRNSNYLGHGFHFGDHYVDDMENLRPWAITYYIWGIRGYSDIYSAHGVDRFIGFQARRTGKPCAGLETAAQHVDVMSGMADIDAELMLLDALVRGDKRRDDYDQLRDAWKRGDVAKLIALDKRERDLNPGSELRLLDYRNLRWIPKIQAAFNSGKPTAIVAGTAHFCGTNSVVDLLQKKGYKVEQL